ncbi:MAG: flagellar protein FlgN [Thermodesulfobacteriota bacterium]
MNAGTTHDYLVRLRDVIIKERESAIKLDLAALADAMEEKEELVRVLAHVKDVPPEDTDIAAQVRDENRRNAYLFKATLGWIKETMEFFGKNTVTSTYSSSADTVANQVNGRLLSGRV